MNLSDGDELGKEDGDELFEWVWRHPNVCFVLLCFLSK